MCVLSSWLIVIKFVWIYINFSDKLHICLIRVHNLWVAYELAMLPNAQWNPLITQAVLTGYYRWRDNEKCRIIKLEGPEDPHLRNPWFQRSCDLAHASIPLAQTPWGLTGRAWLQAGAQRVVIVVFPPLNSLGIDSPNDRSDMELTETLHISLSWIELWSILMSILEKKGCVIEVQLYSSMMHCMWWACVAFLTFFFKKVTVHYSARCPISQPNPLDSWYIVVEYNTNIEHKMKKAMQKLCSDDELRKITILHSYGWAMGHLDIFPELLHKISMG